ncbi:hypothetical protein [Sphingomonas oryzagri]|uniref:Uncharacterized protein n=1 Tax=Sphingomonas oryzagri TaxID=3042314 RepID=A0ABT6N3L3_9SPHN|nr:hypothetical protein [Sphingomonas oryzagri]MDH7638961.1 hypothetical protein [Sphingomonas oryzagri]
MATDPSGIIANLLAGTGYGRTVGDYQQQNIQNQLGQQQLAMSALQAQALQQKQAQEARWQAWSADYAKDPTPQKLSQGIMMFPDQADALQKSYQVMDEPARISRVTQLSQIYNAANAGRADLASQQIDGIINAEKQQGIDTSEAEGIKASLAAGDKDALTQLKAFAQAHLAAASPEFAKAIGVTGGDKDSTHVINPGGALVDNSGRELYRATDAAPKYQVVKNADGSESIVSLGGGDPSSGTAAAPGGSGAPLSVRLNNPGAIRSNPSNRWQGQVGDQNGFVQFDTPENGARAHRIVIGNQIKNGYDTPLKWAQHYAPASDGNNPQAYAQTVADGLGIGINDKIPLSAVPKVAAISARVEAGGTPSPASQGNGARTIYTSQGGKQGYSILTPQEVSAIPGLDPQTVYQRSPTGEISAVGGQNKSQLKPWPQQALSARSTNTASLTNIDNALRLLDPKNDSPQAKAARNAIGPTTGSLGTTFTNWNDPAGTNFRAQIGQIGGVIIKDISGAAVSAAEDERLKKWVPGVTDSPSAARAKLMNLRREIVQRNQAMDDTFSEDQGYRPFKQQDQASSGFRILRVRPK